MITFPAGFINIFFNWVGETNYSLKMDFYDSMLKEKDFFMFLYAWLGALQNVKKINLTQVVLAPDKECEIIKNLFLVCLYGTKQEQQKAFNTLPTVDYKKFFDFLLDKNNMNFMLGISKKYFDFSLPILTLNENVFKVFGGLPSQYIIHPKKDYTQVGLLPSLKVSFKSKYIPNYFYVFKKKDYKIYTTCKNKTMINYVKRRTKHFKNIIVYFSYYKFANSNKFIFFPLLINNNEVILENIKTGVHHISDVDKSLIKLFTTTIKNITVIEPTYTCVSSIDSVFTNEDEFIGGVYLYGVKGFVHTSLEYTTCCTFSNKYIKNKLGKIGKISFILGEQEVIKNITFQYKRVAKKLLYLEARVYYLPNNVVKYIPIKLKRKGSICKFCGNLVRESTLPYCGKCRGRISKFLRSKNTPSIITTTSKVLKILDNIDETKITVIGKGTKYMLSAVDGKVIMVKRFRI